MEASELHEPVAPPAESNGAPAGEQWQRQRDGRQFIPKPGGKGKIFRQGEETVAQARARDAIPLEERRPRRKGGPKLPPKPKAPSKIDMKALEKALADAFSSPAMFCGMAGDEWGVAHFTATGPHLARNLVAAAEHNPWLRAKLEAAASGEQMMMQFMTLMGVGGALIMYAVPPMVYYLNLPLSDERRKLLSIPPRKTPDAPEPPPDQPTESPFFPPEPAAAPAA